MATFLTNQTRFQTPFPTAPYAGDVIANKLTHTFLEAVGATDILDFLILPAFHEIIDAHFAGEGTFTGLTGSFGIMTGVPGDKLSARTVGNELFAAADLTLTTIQRMSKRDAILLPAVNYDRSIGFVPSGSIAAASSKKITFTLLMQARQS